MTDEQRPEGFILAGGVGSRMGSTKATLKVGGEFVISRVVRALESHVSQIRIVTDRPDEVSFLGLPTIPDVHLLRGPLGGLHAAMNSAESQDIVLAACDMPLLSSRLVATLIDLHGDKPVTLPRTPDGIHPLCAVYSTNLRTVVDELLIAGRYSMRGLIDVTGAVIVDLGSLRPPIPPHELLNLNTPQDIAKASAFLRS